MNLIRSAILSPLLEKLRDPFKRFGMDFVAFGPAAFEWNGRIDNRHGVAQPAAKTLHLADDLDVLIPVHTRCYRPHDFSFVKDVDIIVDDDSELQVGHFDEGLHAGFVRLVLKFLLDRDVTDAAATTRGGQMDRLNAGDIFLDDVVNAAFFGNAAEVPMVHMTRPKILHDGIFYHCNGGEFDDRHLHFTLIVTQDLAERVLRVPHVRRDFAFNDDLRVRRYHEFVAPSRRWREAQRLAQKSGSGEIVVIAERGHGA